MIHAAVLGSPISHSLSPLLHNCAYRELGVDGHYEAIELSVEQFPEFMSHARDEQWRGFSLTMPLKEAVLKVADEIDPIAAQIGSANLLLFDRNRATKVESTDVTGFSMLFDDINLDHSSTVTIIGAGGTARAALFALDTRVSEITVIARSHHRRSSLQKCVTNANVEVAPWSDLGHHVSSDLVINTTPSETSRILTAAFNLRRHLSNTFIDAVYAPRPRETIEVWRERGGKAIDGTELLIAQAIPQIIRMVEQDFDQSTMRKVLQSAIAEHFHRN